MTKLSTDKGNFLLLLGADAAILLLYLVSLFAEQFDVNLVVPAGYIAHIYAMWHIYVLTRSRSTVVAEYMWSHYFTRIVLAMSGWGILVFIYLGISEMQGSLYSRIGFGVVSALCWIASARYLWSMLFNYTVSPEAQKVAVVHVPLYNRWVLMTNSGLYISPAGEIIGGLARASQWNYAFDCARKAVKEGFHPVPADAMHFQYKH